MPLVNRIQHQIPIDLATGPRNTRIYLVKRCEALHSSRRSHWVPVTGRTGGNCGSGWGCVAQTGVPSGPASTLQKETS